MKHIFIINPNAGIVDRTADLLHRIRTYFEAIRTEYYVFVTESPGHATEIVRTMCGFSSFEKVRFYSCGGGGTLFEVVNGIADFNSAEVAMLPLGKKNEILTMFGGVSAPFRQLSSLVNGSAVPLDAVRVNGKFYALNKICLGFDDKVAADINRKFFIYLHALSPFLADTLMTMRHCVSLGRHTFLVEHEDTAVELDLHFAVIMSAVWHYTKFFGMRDSSVRNDLLKTVAVQCTYDLNAMSLFSEFAQGKLPAEGATLTIFDGKVVSLRRKDGMAMLLSMDGESIAVNQVQATACPGLVSFVLPAEVRGVF